MTGARIVLNPQRVAARWPLKYPADASSLKFCELGQLALLFSLFDLAARIT